MRSARIFAVSIVAVFIGISYCQTSSATVPGQNGQLLITEDDQGFGTLLLGDPVNGSEVKISGFASNYGASFSPDGASIGYIQNPGDQLWTKRLDEAGFPKQVTSELSGYVSSPVFTPDGSSILYGVGYDFDPGSELWEMPLAGGKAVSLGYWTNYNLDLAISPDGKRLALVTQNAEPCGGRGCYTFSDPRIVVMERDGSYPRTVDTDGLDVYNPSFSPDGSRIAFSGRPAGSNEPTQIYSSNPDGSRLNQLTSTESGGSYPVYSPDGSEIAYSSNGVRIMDADGSNDRGIIPLPEGSYLNDWQRKAPFVIKDVKRRRLVLPVRVFGKGDIRLSGRGIRSSARNVEPGTARFKLKLRKGQRKRLRVRGKISFKVKVRFSPEGALPNSITKRVTLRVSSRAR